MAAANPLAAIPTGTFPLRLAPGLGESSLGEGSKKRKRQSDNIVGLRYNFKPASITPDTPGGIHTENASRSLKFDMPSGGQQVFDLREETAKPRECVLIWDDDTQSFTLHSLTSTLQLTLNRAASSTTASSGPTPAPFSASSALSANNSRQHPRPPSTSSSTSSAAVPLSAHAASGSMDARKRSRPSVEPSAVSGGSKGGKTLPPKQPLAISSASSGSKVTSSWTKSKGKPKAKASASAKGKGKSTAKGEESKIKSAEIIEDSDEEAAGYDISGNAAEEEEDEFAMLVGQSLAGGLDDDADEDEEEDDEEDEGEEEDEALGGAKVVLEADGSEWV